MKRRVSRLPQVRARIVPKAEARMAQAIADYFRGFWRRQRAAIERDAARALPRAKADPTATLSSVDWNAEERELRRIIEPLFLVTGQDAFEAAGEDLGITASFDLAARSTAAIRSSLGKRIVGIGEVSRSAIEDLIARGVDEGLSLGQIVNGVPNRFPGIAGLVDSWSSTGAGRGILGPLAPAAERIAHRAPPLRNTRAYLIAQTETGNAFNLGAISGYRESGLVDFVEVFDGPECGWLTHQDPDLAHGSIRDLDEAQAHPLAHPRCQRAFGARVDATKPQASPYRKGEPGGVPGATPGLRPEDTQPFSGRQVPTAPPARRPEAELPPAVSPADVAKRKKDYLDRTEASIRELRDHEEGSLIDEDGRVLVDRKVGGTDYVDWTPEYRSGIMNGATMTHNHPIAFIEGRPWAASFSPQDVSLHFDAHLAESRAVGLHATHTLRTAPGLTWETVRIHFADADAIQHELGWKTLRPLESRVFLAGTKSAEEYDAAVKAFKAARDLIEADHFHQVWTRVAQSLGPERFTYRRVFEDGFEPPPVPWGGG